ncbi:MAG: RNA polymerase sigma-70 factor [Ferruginibacter sp.]
MLSGNPIFAHVGDSELFQLVKQNDDVKAFEELYVRYWPALVNAAFKRLDCKEQSEDIVQNIFIDIYNRRTTIDLSFSFKAYLHQALKFKVLNEYRSESIRKKYKQSLFFSPGCKIDFSDPLEAKELEQKINTILNELPVKCKEVFLLSRRENLSNRDISAGLKISVSSVEKHITRALKSLRCQI